MWTSFCFGLCRIDRALKPTRGPGLNLLKGLFSFFNTKKKKKVKNKISKINGHIASKIIGCLIWPNVMFLILFKWIDSITFPFSIKFMFISVLGSTEAGQKNSQNAD